MVGSPQITFQITRHGAGGGKLGGRAAQSESEIHCPRLRGDPVFRAARLVASATAFGRAVEVCQEALHGPMRWL